MSLAAAPTGTHLQRIKGTVGYAAGPGASKNDVTTSATVADGAQAYAGCSSLAALDFPSGATAMIGGGTSIKVPANGGPAYLDSGVVQFRSDTPFSIGTKAGTIAIKRGTGYVLAGKTGVEIVSVDAGASDVVFATDKASFAVPGGKSLAQPVTSGQLGTAVLVDNSGVNNPAIYQFNQGRNPLDSSGSKPLDPTGSPTADCKFATAAAGVTVGTIVAALLGAGAVAAVSMSGKGGGGNIEPSSPTPFATTSGSPTSEPTRSPVPSGAPTGSSAPTTAPSTGPSTGPTTSPSTGPTTGPTTAPTTGPSGAPTSSPSSAPTATPTAGPSSGPLGAVILNPAAILINPGLGAAASATITASQTNFTGSFTAAVTGCTGIGAAPTVSVVSTGPGTANIVVTATGTLNLNLGCTVVVTGGGGDKGSAPVTITLAGGATPTPSPSTVPTGSPTLGPVTLVPASVILNPGLGSSATATIAAAQSGYTGSFTASVSGCTGVGAPPTATVVSTGAGTANVVLTSTGAANLNLGCTVTVTGGGGATATAPVTVTLAVLSSPTPVPSSSPTAAPLGPVVLNPASVLLNPGLGSSATANVAVTQSGYTGTYTANARGRLLAVRPFSVALSGCIGVGTVPTATITSTGPGTANLAITATGTVNLNLGCTATVTGGGNMSASESVTVTLSALSSPAPSPSPTASGAIGKLTVNPTSVLLNPGLGSAATAAIAVTQPNFTGTFTAAVSGCTGVGSPPVAAVTGTGVGTATVTVSADGVLNANLGCTLKITGGNGKSASVPVTVTLSVAASPTPAPSPTGTALGKVVVNPTSILLQPGIGSNASANVVASQANFTGTFGASLSCPVELQQPTVTVAGTGTSGQAVVTVTVPGPIGAAIACTLTVSGGGGKKATVPVTIAATVGGGATPTPQPSGAPGPLVANPSSILLNPGVTTSATQNVALTDPGYTGAYGATIACATASLPPALAQLFTTPAVSVSGSNLTITVPGEPLGLSLGCDVTVSTSVPQSLTVPITISVAALQGLKRHGAGAGNSAMLFTPATVAMEPRGTRAAGSFAVSGVAGPYTSTVACPANAVVRTTTLGNLIELDQANVDIAATCLVTVTSASGVSSQVPVRLYAAATGGTHITLPGTRRIALGRAGANLRIGETQSISLTGIGPFEFSGCDAFASVRQLGNVLLITAKASGACTLTVRGPGGASASLSVTVGIAGRRLTAPESGRGGALVP